MATLRDEVNSYEWELIQFIVLGMNNKHIAYVVGTTEQTIKNHLRLVYSKTGTSDRLELACRWAWEKMERERDNSVY